ncbi:Uncharacterized protein FKW44_008756, partial [Caligus rogercresseyi]
METPDFRSYFLIRIKLARTVNEIHGDCSLPSLTPALASLPSRDGPQGPVLDPPCETNSEEDDDSDGVHLQAEVGIDHCTTCRDHSRPEHHDKVPEDDWEALSQPEKDKIRLKDCLLMWDNA